MQITIVGQDTLAAAARECCARHFELVALGFEEADILWICYDTPIGRDGEPDAARVVQWITEDISKLGATRPLILISSQLPAGTTHRLQEYFPGYSFAYSPENIRVATAVKDFENQSRIVVGVKGEENNEKLEELLSHFTKQVIFTDPATAEMVKHALNCYLGLSIAFANEISRICPLVGADMDTITLALRTDVRVSPNAPLRAGAPFGGGHLARDIFTVSQIAKSRNISIPLISHIEESNRGPTGSHG